VSMGMIKWSSGGRLIYILRTEEIRALNKSVDRVVFCPDFFCILMKHIYVKFNSTTVFFSPNISAHKETHGLLVDPISDRHN
jgi:hypothetical protein